MRATVALVGVGRMGRMHLRAIAEHPSLSLLAWADINQSCATEMRRRASHARGYPSLDALLAREKPEWVIIATQAPEHHSLVLRAARAGVSGILVEKPLALSLKDADEMIAACAASGTLLAVNHHIRFARVVRDARAAVAAGAVGEIAGIHVFEKDGRGAGFALFESTPHLLEIARLLCGDAAGVSAHISSGERFAEARDIFDTGAAQSRLNRASGLSVGDSIHALIAFRGAEGVPHRGLVGGAFHAYGRAGKGPNESGVLVAGTAGTLCIKPYADAGVYLSRERSFFPRAVRRMGASRVAVCIAPLRRAAEKIFLSEEQKQYRFHRPLLRALYDDMLTARRDGRPPATDGVGARKGLEIIMAMFESAKMGRRVALPLVSTAHPLAEWE